MGGDGSKPSVIQRALPSHWKFSRFQDLKEIQKEGDGLKVKGKEENNFTKPMQQQKQYKYQNMA